MRFGCSECLEYIYYNCIGKILFYVVAICYLGKAFIELNCCCCFRKEESQAPSSAFKTKQIEKDIENQYPVEEHKSHEVTNSIGPPPDIENQMEVAGDSVNPDLTEA